MHPRLGSVVGAKPESTGGPKGTICEARRLITVHVAAQSKCKNSTDGRDISDAGAAWSFISGDGENLVNGKG